MKKFLLLLGLVILTPSLIIAQDTEEEEDWSMYDDLEFEDESVKRYATSKVTGLSPAQLISIGYDVMGPYDLEAGAINGTNAEKMPIDFTHGLRMAANVPVYSRNSLIVQVGFNYWQTNFSVAEPSNYSNDFNTLIANEAHRTMGLNTTIFKPFNEETFTIVQASADLNGDYKIPDFQNLKHLRYSFAALYGWKKSDRLMYGFGIAQTYRVGELNYVPIFLYNWTHPGLKWGAEVLFPAKAYLRYTFDPRSLLLFGFELQGQSYRLNNNNNVNWNFENLELRRGEIRLGANYQRQLSGFIWASVQAGYRINYRFNVDDVSDGEFTRLFGIVDDRPYTIENTITNPWYFNFTITLVSP